MASQEALRSVSLPAYATLVASQFRFVSIDSDGLVNRTGGAGLAALGVLQNKPAAAQRPAEVAYAGRVKVVAGATVAMGAKVQSDATGRAITAAGSDVVLGKCLIGGDVGELIEVLLVSKHIIPTP